MPPPPESYVWAAKDATNGDLLPVSTVPAFSPRRGVLPVPAQRGRCAVIGEVC